ncbi:MAG: N-acetyltransferase, partial [Bacilli bacterium]
MAVDIRKAALPDVPFLLRLEENFPPSRRFDKAAVTRSVTSPHQDVYIISDLGQEVGSVTVWRHEKTWRVYTIAVASEFRGHDYGRFLMRFVINKAKENAIPRIVLEADAKETRLLQWYESFGFVITGKLKDYYGPKEPGVKMTLVLKEEPD